VDADLKGSKNFGRIQNYWIPDPGYMKIVTVRQNFQLRNISSAPFYWHFVKKLMENITEYKPSTTFSRIWIEFSEKSDQGKTVSTTLPSTPLFPLAVFLLMYCRYSPISLHTPTSTPC
jgi:hypothetical protein